MEPASPGERTMAAVAASVLIVAALVPGLRLPALILLVIAALGTWARLARVPTGLAAALPVAIVLSWPSWLGADAPLGPAGCAEPLAVIAVRRLVVFVVVALAVVVMAQAGAVSWARLGLRRATMVENVLGLLGGLAIAVGGLVVGPILAEPFFGRLTFERPLAAVLPAVVFGVANGILEELAYRGVLQGLLGSVVGRWPAILLQAAVFGISHVGPEVTALVPLHGLLMASAAVVAGLVVDRTRSLAIPIGVHIGADVALYFGLACRTTGA